MTNISSQITHYTPHLIYISLCTHISKSTDCWTQRVTRGLERLHGSESLEGPYCLQVAPECRHGGRVHKLYTSNPFWQAAGGRQSCCRVAESSQTFRSKLWSRRTLGTRCWAVRGKMLDRRVQNHRPEAQEGDWMGEWPDKWTAVWVGHAKLWDLSVGEAWGIVESFLPAPPLMCTLKTGW